MSTRGKYKYHDLDGLASYNSANFILFLINKYTRFPKTVELSKRESLKNIAIKTYVKICKQSEMSKFSGLDPHFMYSRKLTEN